MDTQCLNSMDAFFFYRYHPFIRANEHKQLPGQRYMFTCFHTRFINVCLHMPTLDVTKPILICCVFVSALNLVYVIIPTIPLILLFLTVTGVCCYKLLTGR